MLFTILNIVLIAILCFSSFCLTKHRVKANSIPVSGKNQIDKLYELYFTKKYKIFRLINIIIGALTFILAGMELLTYKYYRFLNFNEGSDFMKKIFMDYFLKTDNLLRDKNTIIIMLISMLVLLVIFVVNLLITLKVRKAFYDRVKQFMKENIPSMYDHVHFKPLYVVKEKELVLCQDRFNKFRFNQNKHTFDRYYKNTKFIDVV